MKSIFTLLALALASALSFPEPMNDDGHQLTALWAQYEEARKADRPQKEAEILSQIKKEAMDRRLPVDFYDAATKYVSTVERRDWKQREPALKTLAEEVESFDFPIVTVLWMDEYQHAPSDRQWAYVKEHLEGFQGKNTPFYRGIGSFLGGNLGGFVGSDKEYVLWRLLQRRSFVHIENDEVYQALAAEVKGTYPNEPALEYYALNARFRYSVDDSVREKALQELAAKYQGRSVSVYPRADILRNRFSRMVKEKASGEAFRQLYEECEAFEAERTAFKGDDATIVKGCTHVKSLCETLTAASIGVRANRQEVCLTFKNLKKADVTLYRGFSTDGKKLRTWKAENPAGSFFVADTLLLPMPSLPDGDYLVLAESGDHTDRASYRQYTLSIATRADADGRKVYVTDYITAAQGREDGGLLHGRHQRVHPASQGDAEGHRQESQGLFFAGRRTGEPAFAGSIGQGLLLYVGRRRLPLQPLPRQGRLQSRRHPPVQGRDVRRRPQEVFQCLQAEGTLGETVRFGEQ